MRPCNRCGKPVDNIETHCGKCEAYFLERGNDTGETDHVSPETPIPHDWGMDLIVLVLCGSATLGGALIGWIQQGVGGAALGGLVGFVLAGLITRTLVAW